MPALPQMLSLPADARCRRAAPAFAALTILLPAFAAAQPPGPPIPLIPSAPPLSKEPAPPPGAKPAITSEPLSAPAPGWSGDIAPPKRPLPANFWQGTPRAVADILLSRLPETTSPALQSLERSLLLSPAAAPSGPDMPGMSLPALRAAALLRFGKIDAARAVLAAAPQSEQPSLRRLAVAADTITGNLDRACATVRRAIRGNQDAFWQRALIGCQALAGENTEAQLGLQLLAEEKLKPGRALTSAVAALSGHAAAAVTRLDNPTPLLLQLLVKAKLPLTRSLIDSLSPELALTLALDETAPPAIQLAAAERAARFGALSPARLAALYTALAATAGGDDPSLLRARRFAAIADAASAGVRLARIIAFARDFAGRQDGGWMLAARLVAPQLQDIDPDPALAGLADPAARLALAANLDALAQQWAQFLSGTARARLDFLLALAMPDKGASGSEENIRQFGPPALRIALRAAFDRPVPAQEWSRLPAGSWTSPGPPDAPVAPWLVLLTAVPAKRVGETVLASLMIAGAKERSPVALCAAIGGLDRVGLAADARRLAVDAALAAGL
jgi:hypothetical protein